MKKVKYISKANPDLNVDVPAGIARKAEGLVKIALKNPKSDEEISRAFGRNRALFNPGVLHAYSKLEKASREGTEGPDYLKLEDKLYLKTCRYYNQEIIYDSDGKRKKGEEADEAEKLERELTRIMAYLK